MSALYVLQMSTIYRLMAYFALIAGVSEDGNFDNDLEGLFDRFDHAALAVATVNLVQFLICI